MTDKENLLSKKFTPSLIFEYINTYTENKNVTYSEFRGITKINITEYILVINYTDVYDSTTDSFDRQIEFIDLERFKLFLLKKRFSK